MPKVEIKSCESGMNYLAEEWVDALRSGKYKQGEQLLRQRDSGEYYYCCLGVLCDLVDSSEWEDCAPESHEAPKWYSYTWMEENAIPPKKITDKVGLTQDQVVELTDMNDGGYPFREIADRIEEMLKDE